MKKSPGRIVTQENVRGKDDKVEVTVPRRVEEEELLEEIESIEEEQITTIKGIGNFAKKSLIVLGLLFSILIIGTVYDATMTASSMLQNAPVIGIIYLVLLFTLIGILFKGMISEFFGYKKLKRIDRLQELSKAYQETPSADVVRFAKELVSSYTEHENSDIAKRAKLLISELDSLMYDEVIERVDEKLLQPLDKLARESIVKYANQTALSTAISPVALIDAVLILSRSHVMVHEIAKVYGYRPNLLGEIVLFKKVFVTLAFASVTDIMANHSHDILGTSIISKISTHGAQGIANGILVARVGLGTMKACRPIDYHQSNESFLKGLSRLIAEALFNKKST